MLTESHQIEKIEGAAGLIRNYALVTPLAESKELNSCMGARVLLKLELFQRTGSFKIRGAANQFLSASPGSISGLVAASSGNHACATAYIGRERGLPVFVIMPDNAPLLKLRKAKSYYAKVIKYDRFKQDRNLIAKSIAKDRGYTLIESSNSLDCVYGQATVGLEIFQQTRERDIVIDTIVVPCCGGGLAAGMALSSHLYKEKPSVFFVEPCGHDKMHQSLKSQNLKANMSVQGSLCDALVSTTASVIPFNILRQHKNVFGISVNESYVIEAMKILYDFFGIMPEPSAAAAFAAVLANEDYYKGKSVVVVITGGNIYKKDFLRLIEAGSYRTQKTA